MPKCANIASSARCHANCDGDGVGRARGVAAAHGISALGKASIDAANPSVPARMASRREILASLGASLTTPYASGLPRSFGDRGNELVDSLDGIRQCLSLFRALIRGHQDAHNLHTVGKGEF